MMQFITLPSTILTTFRQWAGIVLVLTTVPSAATAKPLTYICIEQKSVGWLIEKDGTEKVGKFASDQERFFIKYYAVEVGEDGSLVRLPFIQSVRQNKASKYEYATCDSRFSFEMMSNSVVESGISRKDCHDNLTLFDEIFGHFGILWTFDPPLWKQPSSTIYNNVYLGDSRGSLIYTGSCVSAN